jgi:putative heme-binding domain-containing protein
MKSGQTIARAVCALVLLTFASTATAQFTVNTGDNIAFIGNALPDRMQHTGWLETYLHKANPDKQLTIRNLGFTGDQVASRPRNENFMSADDYLTLVEADIIFAFFGYNESFDQDPEQFKKDLTAFINETQQKKYNGESAPRIVLLSPIAHEDLNSPNLPDGKENNRRLSAYTDAMASVARRKKVPFVDLYYISEGLYEAHSAPLTINGVHLNALGDQEIAKAIINDLQDGVDLNDVEAIRTAVLEKNWCWFNRYRATDGNDVWGSREGLEFVDGQTNGDVLLHELAMLDVMTANRDKVIWQAIVGETRTPDDSNVPLPVPVVTNIEPDEEKRTADGAHKFVKPEDGVGTLKLEDGMVANLFASEEMFPELVNPVQLDVDTKGRLWVAAWETYPKWEPNKEMLDRLLILPDEDRDGVADSAITFAYVHNPTGFTFWNGGVIVASAPNLLFLKDTDGDDVADVRDVILSGLDSSDTHHSANGFDYGPDGYIYYQRGIFNVSNVETPWQSAQLSGSSAMYRFNPRTHRFSLHAHNNPNPHGGDFDYWGYHYATSATGGEAYQIRESGDGKFEMHELLKKTVRPVPSSGIISSTHFPEKNNGNFIILNSIGFLGIKQYTLENTDGRVWGTETDNLLISNDSNFRPADFKFGDDGAMYVADWANPIIGHMQHNVRDPNRDHEHGRIYRITVEGRALQDSVKIDGEPIEALLDVLKHPTDGVRLRARIELSERNTDAVIAAAQQWADQFDVTKKENAHHLLEVLWLHQQHNVVNRPLLSALLDSPEPHAQRAAQRVKYMWDIEEKFDEKVSATPKSSSAHEAHAILAAARDYRKQEKSPEPRMVGDTFEIHIQTLIEQMKYDRTEFTVEAGMKIRVVFSNPDSMDHNMIFVEPGAAPEVAVAAMRMETTGEGVEKQWIPESKKIIIASNLLSRGETQVMEFAAPTDPGLYDYICTFPGHWQLMRGIMIVVDELSTSILIANQSTITEAPPPTASRDFVEYWALDHLKDEVDAVSAKRSYETGKQMFQVASCTKCHTMHGKGNALGPDLTDISTRYSALNVLEHILDPSLEVADEYKTFIVETKNQEVHYGQVVAQNEETMSILGNWLDPDSAVTLKRTDIKTIESINASPMPTDLLITLNKSEIWDLLAYLLSGDDAKNKAFK